MHLFAKKSPTPAIFDKKVLATLSENLQNLRENDLPFQQYEKFVKNASGFCVKIENYRKFGENVVG